MARDRGGRTDTPPAPSGGRASRRAAERAAEKAARQREAEARRAPGGEPSLPIEITTAAIVEPRAEALGCPRCLGHPRAVDHRAEIVDGVRLRVAAVRCGSCGLERLVWFRILTLS